MAASIFDSPMYAKSFPTGEAGRLFTETAKLRAILLVLGTLAKTQGEAGIIPVDSAFFIDRSALEVQVDPAGLAADLAAGQPLTTALVTPFAKAMEAPDHSKYIFHDVDATEIEWAAQALRLRQFIALSSAALAEPKFQSDELMHLAEALKTVKADITQLSMPSQPSAIHSTVAEALRLQDAPNSVPTDGIQRLADWAVALTEVLAERKGDSAPRITTLALQSKSARDALAADPQNMTAMCLPQICLGAYCALLLA